MTSTTHADLRTRTASDRGFLGVSALLFAASAAATVAWCASMAPMSRMLMPVGWMPICGQSWPSLAASFVGMWIVMMAAMMLPSLVPMLWRYRQAVRTVGAPRLGLLTALAGLGYLVVWAAVGVAVFALGAGLAALTMAWPMLARGAPIGAGMVVLMAGAAQFSKWKARHLARCRVAPVPSAVLPAGFGTAWRYGLHLGGHCVSACAGLAAILLVTGIMDLRAMVAVSVAMTLERLVPAGGHVARIVGVVAAGGGGLLILRAVVFG